MAAMNLVVEITLGVLHVLNAPASHAPSPSLGFRVVVNKPQKGEDCLGNTMRIDRVYTFWVVFGRAISQKQAILPESVTPG
ncbi:MAG: hypothetical protein KAV87_43445, partial [Desulfobacteraceae bacterium]|nr:hypothetical protein [Desulfobacteraceae bacterium]